MGPRLVSRGKTILGGGRNRRCIELQWGRDLLVAESPVIDVPKEIEQWLQWGRDLLVAERPWTSGASPRAASFNGAATC